VEPLRITPEPSAIPTHGYNVVADLANPPATFEAGVSFARTEGVVPVPAANHAIRAAIDEALRCRASGEARTTFFNLRGHGHFDRAAYDRYFSGELEDSDCPAEAIEASLARLPKIG